MISHLLIYARGFCMGAADVVPGVSGGTMAFILGIYERLLLAIRSFDLTLVGHLAARRWRPAWRHTDLLFLMALGLGIASALAFFTRVVPLPKLIQTDPEPIFGLFLGLIIGSVYVLLRGLGRVAGRDLLWLAIGTAIGGFVVTLTPVETPQAGWFIFVSGMLAITAMILPGISGSFILLILRKYAYIFDGLGRLDFAIIVPFGLGAVVGLMLFSRVLSWLLNRHHRAAILGIAGFLVASLWVIWPFQLRSYVSVRGKQRLLESTPILPDALDGGVVFAIAMAVTGFAAVTALEFVSRQAHLRARPRG